MKGDLRFIVKSNRFGAIDRRMHLALSGAVRTTAFVVQGKAKQNIVAKKAVDTGNLLNSIAVDIESPLVAWVGTAVHYAPYIEYGTVFQAARPYLVPAVESERQAFADRCRAAMGGVA